MAAPLLGSNDALVRPWRTATLIATLIASVELVLLLVAGFFLLAKPLSRAMRHHAEAVAFTAPKHTAAKPAIVRTPVAVAHLTRAQTGIFVLNGNGRAGAASAEASKLQQLGYRVRGTGNAAHTNYATTVVMYRGAFRGEALRLARDLHLQVVGPLDGLAPSALHGGQLALLLGAAG